MSASVRYATANAPYKTFLISIKLHICQDQLYPMLFALLLIFRKVAGARDPEEETLYAGFDTNGADNAPIFP